MEKKRDQTKMNDYLSHQLSRLNKQKRKEPSYYSFIIFFCFVALSILGLITLYSANQVYFASQVKHVILGSILFIAIGFWVPLRFFQSLAFFTHFILFVSLCLVLLFGHTAGGAQRWLHIGSFARFQPSEFIKVSTVLFLANFFYNEKLKSEFSISEIWLVLLNAIFVFLVIFFQPDFGTAGLLLAISLAQLAFVKIKFTRNNIYSFFALLVTSPVLGWLFFLKPYQKLRILNLLNPERDPLGSGYNSLQSLVAIGSGGFLGKGFMQGTQTHLYFLPARHTDFIFSVFSEEFGFLGCLVVFILFFILFSAGLSIAKESGDMFKKLTAIGLTAFLFLEFLINIAMVLGVFPVVGMALPFFSAGGSSELTVCVSAGLLVAIDRSNQRSSKDLL